MRRAQRGAKPRSGRAVGPWLAAAIAVAIGFGMASPIGAGSDGIVLTRVQGSVEVGRGEPPVWSPAGEGQTLAAGDSIRTARGARAELQLGSGIVRLYGDSLLRIPTDAAGSEGAVAVELERGDSLFEVIRNRLRQEFEVRTPEVVVSVKGTRFGVSLGDSLAAVSVYRGTVGLRSLAEQVEREVLVRAGFAAIGGLERAFELVVMPELDPWDAWSTSTSLPAGPRELLGTKLESTALERAREVGRRNARVELAKKVAEERPELVREALEARARKMQAQRVRQMQLEQAGPRPDALPANLEPLSSEAEAEAGVILDRFADAGRLERQAKLQMETEVVEALVDTSVAGGTSEVAAPFDIKVVTSGGPNSVVISDAAGSLLGQFSQNEIDQILSSGDVSLLGQVLPILETLDVDPMLFTRKLDELI